MTKKRKISLNMVIYNEPIDIICRALQSIDGIVDECVLLVHKDYHGCRPLATLKLRSCSFKFIREDLDDSVVEKWRDYLMDQSIGDWILILDPDEYLDEDAQGFLSAFQSVVIPDDLMGLVFRRKNNEYDENMNPIMDHNYPDPQLRFIRKGYVTYPGQVHVPPVAVTENNRVTYGFGHIIHDKLFESPENIKRKSDLYRRKENES